MSDSSVAQLIGDKTGGHELSVSETQTTVPFIETKDIFDELKLENNRLFNQLSFAQKYIEFFENYRKFTNDLLNSIEVNDEKRSSLNDFESDYQKLLAEKDCCELNVKQKLKMNEICGEGVDSCDRTPVARDKDLLNLIEKYGNVWKSNQKSKPLTQSTDNTRNRNSNTYLCHWPECESSFSTSTEYLLHDKQHYSRNTNNSVKKRKHFNCQICNKQFSDNRGLKRHESIHTGVGVKKSVIKKTNKEIIDAISEGSVKTDIDSNNLKIFSEWNESKSCYQKIGFGCIESDCNYVSNAKKDMYRHIKRKHESTAQLIKCETCECVYLNNDELKQHVIVRHSFKPEVYKCHKCVYETKELSALRRHLNRHSGIRPFICDWVGCERTFITNYELKYHQKVHYGH